MALLALLLANGCERQRETSKPQPERKADSSMTVRMQLIEKIRKQGNLNDPKAPPILVTLEDFFDGNDDVGSITANLTDSPGPQRFCEVLKGIRSKPGVEDVLVRIRMVESDDSWPYSDTIYVLTTAKSEEVKAWVKELRPDEVYDSTARGLVPDWPPDMPFPRPLSAGVRIVYVWWD